jgi:hypothetical protein
MARPGNTSAGNPNIVSNLGNQFPLNTVLIIDNWQPNINAGVQQLEAGRVAVLRGKNFKYKVDGVYSGFGSSALTGALIPPHHMKYPMKIFRVQDRTLLFTVGAVYTLDGHCNPIRSVYTFSHDTTNSGADYFAWTMAQVGGIYFFNHPMSGMIYYDTHEGIWGNNALDPECFKAPVYAINNHGNRLLVLLEDTVNWSEIDDGFKLDCDAHTGAGFQNFGSMVGGKPLGLSRSRTGFYTYTTRGIMESNEIAPGNISLEMAFDGITKSISTGHSGINTYNSLATMADAQYHHNDTVIGINPINSHCIVELPGFDALILTKRGFYLINQKMKVDELESGVWQSLMGDYLANSEFRPNQYEHFDEKLPRVHRNTKVDLNDPNSIRMEYTPQFGELYISFKNSDNALYTKALCYQFTLDRWCSFDQPHYCFGDFHFDIIPYNQKKSFGFISEHGGLQEFNEEPCINLATSSSPVLGSNPSACPTFRIGLDSFVELGLFRTNDFRHHDRLTRVTDVTLQHGDVQGTINQGKSIHNGELSQNWAETLHLERTNRFIVAILGTFDGHNSYDDNAEWLTFNNMSGKKSFYAVDNTAIAHTIMVAAMNINEYFALNALHVTGRVAGRL